MMWLPLKVLITTKISCVDLLRNHVATIYIYIFLISYLKVIKKCTKKNSIQTRNKSIHFQNVLIYLKMY